MKIKTTHLLLAAGLLAASSASAMINIDTVPVGPPGNTGEVQSQGTFGAVDYGYDIGTYEVTNTEYAAFLNAVDATGTNPNGIYNTSMELDTRGGINFDNLAANGSKYSTKTNMGNKPVNYVSFWDATRFANWLTNGQGSGGTEDGVYDLNSTDVTNNTVTRDMSYGFNTLSAVWAVTSEDEWYKAAYYDPGLNSGTGGYWDYPTQSNSITTADANYNNSVGTVTDVGTYSGDASFYGTFDQGGNVWEWNDEIIGSSRGLRGGSFVNSVGFLQSSDRNNFNPTIETNGIGFRVSSLAPIPEPESYAAILGCLGLGLALIRRVRRNCGDDA